MVYKYTLQSGLHETKSLGKKYLVGGIAALAIVLGGSSAAMASHTVVSEQANSNACFGQARASFAKGGPNGILPGDSTNGTFISERKGTNPENNAQYREANCN